MNTKRRLFFMGLVAVAMVIAFLAGATSADIRGRASSMAITNEQWAAIQGTNLILASNLPVYIFLPNVLK